MQKDGITSTVNLALRKGLILNTSREEVTLE